MIAIIRLPSFLFLDDFEGNANISVAIKSGSTASALLHIHCVNNNLSTVRASTLPACIQISSSVVHISIEP